MNIDPDLVERFRSIFADLDELTKHWQEAGFTPVEIAEALQSHSLALLVHCRGVRHTAARLALLAASATRAADELDAKRKAH